MANGSAEGGSSAPGGGPCGWVGSWYGSSWSAAAGPSPVVDATSATVRSPPPSVARATSCPFAVVSGATFRSRPRYVVGGWPGQAGWRARRRHALVGAGAGRVPPVRCGWFSR
ncbi:hypothetical protein KCH_66140 [Kitasatospora cheerisanensis KCTC 2395]|uniref:Uncharacterized protein n=1 Tax=Kitasatospora cheerisanensis KCTC 2395 TaxID=1348663 RepID=A0A066YKI1_9ACTN|nr:hypothetical protein KCH_66140 [Kitasatospora cheerisanensis KCTC 2395]